MKVYYWTTKDSIRIRKLLSWIPMLAAVGIAFWFMRYAYEQKIVQDSTEHRAEAYHKLLYNSDNALVVLNSNGLIIEWNQAAERLFGWKADEVIGADPSFLMTGSLAGKHKQAIKRREMLEMDKGSVIVSGWAVTRTGDLIKVSVYACSAHTINGYYHIAIINKMEGVKIASELPAPSSLKIEPQSPVIIDRDAH